MEDMTLRTLRTTLGMALAAALVTVALLSGSALAVSGSGQTTTQAATAQPAMPYLPGGPEATPSPTPPACQATAELAMVLWPENPGSTTCPQPPCQQAVAHQALLAVALPRGNVLTAPGSGQAMSRAATAELAMVLWPENPGSTSCPLAT